MVGYSSLPQYYQTNFALVQKYKYSLTEIEGMYPYERDLFVIMLHELIEAQGKK